MTRKVMDSRGPHTRAALQHAFKSLLRTRPYESIAVDEICKLANVGRSTFYTHFRSKDDLKRSGVEALRRQLLERQKNAAQSNDNERRSALSFTFDLFAHAREHVDHYHALVGGRGGTVVLRKLKETVTDLAHAELAHKPGSRSSDVIEREAVVQYIVGAFMGVLTWWLDRGATIPIERIDAMFQRFMREGVLGCFAEAGAPRRQPRP
jgi:AcrR family transcriptional regulator